MAKGPPMNRTLVLHRICYPSEGIIFIFSEPCIVIHIHDKTNKMHTFS